LQKNISTRVLSGLQADRVVLMIALLVIFRQPDPEKLSPMSAESTISTMPA